MAFQPIYAIRDSRGKGTLLPYNQGVNDGSTLTLDFTTGVLDPRLTFTRDSNATFINSSGLVQYADANMVRNSVFSGPATPTGWTLGAGGAGATIPSDGVRRCVTTTAAQNFLSSAAFATSIGLVYATTVNIREASGQHYRNAFEITASPTILKYYRNGVEVASGTGEFSTAQAGIITVVWIATSATLHNVRLGVGCTGSNVANAVCEFERIHTTPVFFSGTTTATSPANYTAPAYVPNTDTSAAYHAPRFDYDPTTGAPQGLLIEGTVRNLVTQSNGSTSVWGTGGNRTPTNNTTDLVSPDGTNNATKLVCGSAGAYASFATTISGLTGGATYTISYWIRGPVGHSPRLYAKDGTVGDVTATSTTGTYNNTGWTRLTQTYTLPAATTECFVYFMSTNTINTGDTFYVYGFQMETGSGASSHVPTGASTAQRLADSAVMSDIASLGYSTTNGSVYWSGIINKIQTSFITLIGFFPATDEPSYETFGGNGVATYFTAARGATLSTGGLNEVSRPYVVGSLIKYASSVNTLQDPIVAVNLNGSAGSVNKSGTGNLRAATRFVIGRQPSSSYGVSYPSVTIRSIKYWPTSKVAAELAVLTA